MAFEAAGNCSSATSGGPQVALIMILKNKLNWQESAIFQFGEDGAEEGSNITDKYISWTKFYIFRYRAN